MPAGEVGALSGAIFYAAFGGENLHNRASPVGKPYNRPAGLGNASPFGGWRHHLARWEAYHWILSRLRLLTNPVPLPPPQFGGAAKGKRLNGQARRLTSPHLEVLCRTSTGAL